MCIGALLHVRGFRNTLRVWLTPDLQDTAIRGATITVQLAEGAANNSPVLVAFMSAVYGLDNTISVTAARDEARLGLGSLPASQSIGANQTSCKTFHVTATISLSMQPRAAHQAPRSFCTPSLTAELRGWYNISEWMNLSHGGCAYAPVAAGE